MVKVNDIVQIAPSHPWCAALVVVTEVREWGVKGYVNIPEQGPAYIRLTHEQYKYIGKALFALEEVDNDPDDGV